LTNDKILNDSFDSFYQEKNIKLSNDNDERNDKHRDISNTMEIIYNPNDEEIYNEDVILKKGPD
jgi:hypothetical protein